MYTTHLVHDPNSSLIAGDVIDAHPMPVTSNVRHLVAKVVVPFGKNIDERPPIPSLEELLDEYKKKRLAKTQRRAEQARKARKEAQPNNAAKSQKK